MEAYRRVKLSALEREIEEHRIFLMDKVHQEISSIRVAEINKWMNEIGTTNEKLDQIKDLCQQMIATNDNQQSSSVIEETITCHERTPIGRK